MPLPDASGVFVTIKRARRAARLSRHAAESRRPRRARWRGAPPIRRSEDPRFPPVAARNCRSCRSRFRCSVRSSRSTRDPDAFTIGVHGLVVGTGRAPRAAAAAGRDRVGLGRRAVPAPDLPEGGPAARRLAARRAASSGSPRRSSATDAAARRASLHRRRPAARRRPRGRHALRGAADLHQVRRPVARARAARPTRSRCSGAAWRRPASAGRRAQQLSDQHRGRGAGAARSSRSPRSARSSIAPRRSASTVSSCTRARTRPAARPGAAADCRRRWRTAAASAAAAHA